MNLKAWKELADINMQALLLAVLYILIATRSFYYERILQGLLLLASLAAYLCYGVVVNDYCDITIDLKAGKRREVHKVTRSVLLVLMFSLLLVSFLIAFQVGNLAFLAVLAVTYFLATSYSVHPLRFKERGALGIVVDMLIEKALPLILVLLFFGYFSLDALPMVLFFSVMQLKLILDHQVFDYDDDLRSGVRTFVVKFGLRKSEAILRWILRPMFVLSFLLLCISIYLHVPFSSAILLVIFIGYFILQIMLYRNVFSRRTIRGDIGNWISRIPFYDGYITASLGALLLFIVFSAMATYFPFVLLLPMTVISQLYIIRGHYFRIISSLHRFLSHRLRRPAGE